MKYEIKEVKEFILRCFASAGQSSNSEDAALLINLFCKEVKTNWKRHIRIAKDYPELRIVLSNGMTICDKHHKQIHKELRNERFKN